MASLLHSIFFLIILLHLALLTSAQSPYKNITLGSSLSNLDDNPQWTSQSGEFAFGFHPQQGKPVERGAKIQLTSNGVLLLSTQNGTEIWKPQLTDNSQVASAAILNTGNLVLTTTDSTVVWASFDNPTDTLLPTQTLEPGYKLSSRLTEKNYTLGRFGFSLQADNRNLVMYTIALPTEVRNGAYWDSNTVNTGQRLVFNQSGHIYLTLRNGSIINLSSEIPDSTRDYYQRATLDFDGVLRQYTYPRTSASNGRWPESWSSSWSLPENICAANFRGYGSGICGFNSYCRINQAQRPECECPPGYNYLDPQNTFAGCKQNFVSQSCEKNDLRITHGFEMRSVPSTDWPFGDYEGFKSVNENWCGETCLNDCFCAVAIFREGSCWLKRFPLSRGYMNYGSNVKALIKVGNFSTQQVPSVVLDGKNEKENKWFQPVITVLGGCALLTLLFLLLGFYRARPKKQNIRLQDPCTLGVNLLSFTYKELEEATNGYNEELGKGLLHSL
ncbi:hypothetical protein IFM89_026186 [Coptis chinensis]|uniref:Bulb-type lectin domain-containing protein n=1 Tax=Coptis chinensis TaxID=261450 RepID=A0A835H991_9MAGN|nr:hypothetical protein IFM89_026186 [Coptis chinensis]